MARYVVNRNQQSSGDHEVHKDGCIYFPYSYLELGDHASCFTAVATAKSYYSTANGCYTCSNACHTS